MKIPFGTLTFIIAAVIAIAAVLVFRAFAQTPDGLPHDKKFFLEIGKSNGDFVDLKPDGKPILDAALKALGENNYKIRYKPDATATPIEDYHPPKVTLKTDKVTTSDLAKNEPAGDPNATKQAKSDSAKEIQDVLDAFPSPSP
jgi:hypothetical protein